MFHPIQRRFGRAMVYGLAALTFASFAVFSTEAAAEATGTSTTTGSGSYICTPAGFGSKSRCFPR